jgi:hypothetical protein
VLDWASPSLSVSLSACTSLDNVVPSSCLPCLESGQSGGEPYQHTAHRPFAPTVSIDGGAVVTDDPFIDVDFRHDAHWMNVILPQDIAVSPRDKKLIQNFRHALNDIDINVCSTCHERAFDLTLHGNSNECRRCHADKKENGKTKVRLHQSFGT